jgi:hypothetical protein
MRSPSRRIEHLPRPTCNVGVVHAHRECNLPTCCERGSASGHTDLTDSGRSGRAGNAPQEALGNEPSRTDTVHRCRRCCSTRRHLSSNTHAPNARQNMAARCRHRPSDSRLARRIPLRCRCRTDRGTCHQPTHTSTRDRGIPTSWISRNTVDRSEAQQCTAQGARCNCPLGSTGYVC